MTGRSTEKAYDHFVARQELRRGAVDHLRPLNLASEVGESPVELMLGDFLSPPDPACRAG